MLIYIAQRRRGAEDGGQKTEDRERRRFISRRGAKTRRLKNPYYVFLSAALRLCEEDPVHRFHGLPDYVSRAETQRRGD